MLNKSKLTAFSQSFINHPLSCHHISQILDFCSFTILPIFMKVSVGNKKIPNIKDKSICQFYLSWKLGGRATQSKPEISNTEAKVSPES